MKNERMARIREMQMEMGYTLSCMILVNQLMMSKLGIVREQCGETGSHSLLEKVDRGILVKSYHNLKYKILKFWNTALKNLFCVCIGKMLVEYNSVAFLIPKNIIEWDRNWMAEYFSVSHT